MPQIDVSTFVSQAFWLVLCFCTLWALLSLFIMPKMANIKEQRKRKINEYLFKAEALKTQAQQAIDTYNKIIGDAQFAAEDSLTRGEAELAAHLQETAEIMKKKLSLDDFAIYDTYMSIFDKPKANYTVDEQFEIVKKAVAPLGNDYLDVLENNVLKEHWIDAYSNDNKAGGGYCIAVYLSHPYVLLNDNGDYNSISTMAHELGHAMHSYYSNKNQPSELAGYSIFVAEVASTVNEILLNKYMIKNSKTEEEKLYYIDQYIKTLKGTVYLSQQIFDKKYLELNHHYFGDDVVIEDDIKHEWSRISHFYRPYYVYKYATSFTCACYIANSILMGKEGALENYKNLLKSGGNDWPNNILKKVGIDLENSEPYDIMFNDLENLIKEIEK